ncbi:Hypothetical_protein [Hexamita inflata]|uniref:Hypothetical_protein n=1 Tax=Hexamita inflata TaxID=28002 RepID=A0AA86PDP3_9EUKA|nr:Hypothetical protein HINF_LOCUS24800 [Hexamita inflata]
MQLMLYVDPRPLLFEQKCNIKILKDPLDMIQSLIIFVLLVGVGIGVANKILYKLELLENVNNKSKIQFESVKQELELLGITDPNSSQSNTPVPVQIFVQRYHGSLLSNYQNNFDFE